MTPSPKKPGVAFWATVVVVAVGLYVGSFGPAYVGYLQSDDSAESATHFRQ